MIKAKEPYWKRISIQTVWLEAEDYPRLLQLATLGICLHYSSSGLDLPMKVVDMFGARMPVLAINYKSIGELVQNNVNGQIFSNSADLVQQLLNLFKEWPKGK